MVDLTLRAAFSVEAESEEEARRIVTEPLNDCGTIHVIENERIELRGEATIESYASVVVTEEDLPKPSPMVMYNVFCSRYVEQVCCVQVAAISETDAKLKGRAEASDGDWKDGDGCLELEVTLVERTEP